MLLLFEILSSKILAVYFGTSINTWAVIIGVTLLAILCGYLYSAYYIKQGKTIGSKLFLNYVICAVYTAAIYLFKNSILNALLDAGQMTGIVLSVVVFVFPVVFLLSQTSNLVVGLNTSEQPTSGKIYAVSTLAGVVYLSVYALYIIPFSGINFTLISLIVQLLMLTAFSRLLKV